MFKYKVTRNKLMKNILSDFDLSGQEIEDLLGLATKIKAAPASFKDSLKNKILGMVFQKPSTRTKASFEAAIYQLGGHAIFLDSTNSQISRGESLAETAKILSGYTNGIAARVYYQADLEDMAMASKVPIINALTDKYHTCQILSDLLTIKEKKGKLAELKLVYFGDAGNNVAHSLIISCSKVGIDVTIACPQNEKYQPSKDILVKAKRDVLGKIEITENWNAAAKDADILYTDTWVSMGMEKEKNERINDLMDYQINSKTLEKAKADCIVMHCLPAYTGYEISETVLKGPKSVVYEQAENKMHMQKAVLYQLMKD